MWVQLSLFNIMVKSSKGVNFVTRDSRGKDKELNWTPERNIVHGFTFKGFFIFIIFITIGSLIKYLFF